MLNQTGVVSSAAGYRPQILANVEMQVSVGCRVPQSLGVADETTGRKLAKAGTPIKIDFTDLSKDAEKADGSTAFNAVLLHDVDVTTEGSKNGTALIFGFVNINRLDQDVQTAVTTAQGAEGASAMVTFLKQ